MFEKVIPVLQIIVGFGFVISLFSSIPGLGGVAISLGYVQGLLSMIPFYSFIVVIFGVILFIDGIRRLVHH